MRMRTRVMIFASAVIPVLLAGAAAPAAASSLRLAALNAVGGRLLSTPRPGALITRLPPEWSSTCPGHTRRLLVQLDGRDVTAHFERTTGSLRVASARPSGTRRLGCRSTATCCNFLTEHKSPDGGFLYRALAGTGRGGVKTWTD
jgi:hypothetical protein